MGADLILVALPAANLTDERRERLHEIVSGLSQQELQQFDPDDWDAGSPEELRPQLHEHVAAIHGPDNRRDVVSLHAPLTPYGLWVTGGISWGDDATDIWDCFCLLGSCPAIWAQLQEWACADRHAPSADDSITSEREFLRGSTREPLRAAGGPGSAGPPG